MPHFPELQQEHMCDRPLLANLAAAEASAAEGIGSASAPAIAGSDVGLATAYPASVVPHLATSSAAARATAAGSATAVVEGHRPTCCRGETPAETPLREWKPLESEERCNVMLHHLVWPALASDAAGSLERHTCHEAVEPRMHTGPTPVQKPLPMGSPLAAKLWRQLMQSSHLSFRRVLEALQLRARDDKWLLGNMCREVPTHCTKKSCRTQG